MRILHIFDHSVPLHSGYSFRSLAILRHQRKLGWETFHLTTPRHGTSESPMEIIDGWTFYRTPPPTRPWANIPVVSDIAQMNATARRLTEVAELVRPDILHAHSPALNGIPALRVGRRLGIPVVYEIRAFWEDAAASHGTSREWGPRYRSTRALETYVAKRADAVTTICEGLKGELLTRGISEEKVTVIPNAVDSAAFVPGRADPALAAKHNLGGKSVLGFIGSFYAYEGLDLLLRAMPDIIAGAADAKLLLVGGGPEESSLKALTHDLGLDDKIVFTGRVPHDQVQRYYELVDIFVYPRTAIRLTDLVTPLKPLEAMAQGKIVVASDVGGHRELIDDGETGTLFAADDPRRLSRAVLQVLADRENWPEQRARARHFVETKRSWAASVGRYPKVYENVLAGAAA